MRSHTLISLGFLVLFWFQGISQPSDPSPILEMPFMEGLTLATDVDTPFTLDGKIPIYSEDGESITSHDVPKLMASGDLYLDIYVDDKNKAKALVLRAMTEEEKWEREQLLASVNDATKELIGKRMRPFSLEDLAGNSYTVEGLAGKIVVVNLWFIGCKPCIIEMPELNALVDQFQGEDIVFLALALDSESALKKFLKKKEFKYRIIPDSQDEIMNIGINIFPTHIVIDQESRVTWAVSGLSPNTIDQLEEEIKKIREE